MLRVTHPEMGLQLAAIAWALQIIAWCGLAALLAGCCILPATSPQLTPAKEAEFRAQVAFVIMKFNAAHGSSYKPPLVIFGDLDDDYADSNANCWCMEVDKASAVEDWDDALTDTIPHELAHLIVDDFYGTHLESKLVGHQFEMRTVRNVAEHGPEWCAAMRALGGDPTKHGYCKENTHD